MMDGQPSPVLQSHSKSGTQESNYLPSFSFCSDGFTIVDIVFSVFFLFIFLGILVEMLMLSVSVMMAGEERVREVSPGLRVL